MGTISIEQRFHGACSLVIWHLRRVAESYDLEEGFAAARERGMLSDDKEAFVRRCLDLDSRLTEGLEANEPVTDELIRKLQACTISLNTADSA